MDTRNTQRPKWASKLHNLKNKAVVFTNSKDCPVPSVRTVLVFCWELWEPLLIDFVERGFVTRREYLNKMRECANLRRELKELRELNK